jgi:DNA-directed RNA polymerase subunit beta'
MLKERKTRTKSSVDDIDSVSIKLASPEKIRQWSRGEVKKPETLNYRTARSERDGLFCEKIFGPEKDYECYCGKYKGIRYKGIVCEKCGVEITKSIVRRERMGHIELCVPVSHIWYLKNMPSRIATILGMPAGEVEKVIYFAGYLITKIDEKEKIRLHKELDDEFKSKIKNIVDEKTKDALRDLMATTKADIDMINVGKVLDENQYHKFSYKFGSAFEAGIGGEVIYNILKGLNINDLFKKLNTDLEKATSVEREKIIRRLGFINAMKKSGVRPEWTFIKALPVIPAALRPMVALDGGRQATSDINDLYRRVINRNNRLKKLYDIKAPDVILRNEKRILQEAVDALLDNSMKGNGPAFSGINPGQKRSLKSIADNLKGKRGIFRQNLLGKRVDYSGRSVIVVGPDLKLNQCGLPKHMALELFKPFVISQILSKELAFSIKGANRMIEDRDEEVWSILEDIIKDKYVLLNRAPTLHRLSVQAFQPVLIEGNAIQLHPLVCSPFNADFDGDTMSVHVPLSEEAQYEAHNIMASDKNILKPGSGDATITNKMLDIVVGAFWVTKMVSSEIGTDKYFESPEAAIIALNNKVISYRAPIKVLAPDEDKYAEYKGQLFETTVGRILFNQLLPENMDFINREINKNVMNGIIDELIIKEGRNNVAPIIDSIKKFGFSFATLSGITWSISDIQIPEDKYKALDDAQKSADQIYEAYNLGLLSDVEKHVKIVRLWQAVQSQIEKMIPATLPSEGPVNDMVLSGARGSIGNINQMVGIKGLIATAQGTTIELPIKSSFKEGLTPIEYFISTHGARKGMTDTALNTAKAGYLTRKLFILAQSVIITEGDCGTHDSIIATKKTASGIEANFSKNIFGRILASDIVDANGEIVFKKGHLINRNDSKTIEKLDIESVQVRSPLTCKTDRGVCAHCYGADLSTGELIDIGESVGTVAAQAIGEPGTQLTMRTFHAGGVAQVGGDITAGLPRVEGLFENRTPKNPAAIASHDGVVMAVIEKNNEKIIRILPDVPLKASKKTGSELEFSVHPMRIVQVKVGQHVHKGQIMTDGSADVNEIYEYAGRDVAQAYIIGEVKKIYELQGDNLARKHIEIVVREMFNRIIITAKGDTEFSEGDVVETFEFIRTNKMAAEKNIMPAKGKTAIMGTMEGSLNRQSFLTAASFQNTNRILVNASLKGQHDPLYGIMENTLIGRLIPAGTGFVGSKKHQDIVDLQTEIESHYESGSDEAEVYNIKRKTV